MYQKRVRVTNQIPTLIIQFIISNFQYDISKYLTTLVFIINFFIKLKKKATLEKENDFFY